MGKEVLPYGMYRRFISVICEAGRLDVVVYVYMCTNVSVSVSRYICEHMHTCVHVEKYKDL